MITNEAKCHEYGILSVQENSTRELQHSQCRVHLLDCVHNGADYLG